MMEIDRWREEKGKGKEGRLSKLRREESGRIEMRQKKRDRRRKKT